MTNSLELLKLSCGRSKKKETTDEHFTQAADNSGSRTRGACLHHQTEM